MLFLCTACLISTWAARSEPIHDLTSLTSCAAEGSCEEARAESGALLMQVRRHNSQTDEEKSRGRSSDTGKLAVQKPEETSGQEAYNQRAAVTEHQSPADARVKAQVGRFIQEKASMLGMAEKISAPMTSKHKARQEPQNLDEELLGTSRRTSELTELAEKASEDALIAESIAQEKTVAAKAATDKIADAAETAKATAAVVAKDKESATSRAAAERVETDQAALTKAIEEKSAADKVVDAKAEAEKAALGRLAASRALLKKAGVNSETTAKPPAESPQQNDAENQGDSAENTASFMQMGSLHPVAEAKPAAKAVNRAVTEKKNTEIFEKGGQEVNVPENRSRQRHD